MGKRIIAQARGKGSLTYQARKKAFVYRVGYPIKQGEAKVIEIFHSAAHSAPLMKGKISDEIFYNVAVNGLSEGDNMFIGGTDMKEGNVIEVKNIPLGTRVFNIEKNPGDGGKIIRTSGSSAVINKKYDFGKVGIIMPNKNEVIFDGDCRATIGVVSGEGRKLKPFFKAGKKHFKMKAKNKLYPRTSAVKVNAIDHPFGSGRGKRIKPKIPKRNAPPGAKVGTLRPRRTGRRKR